MKKISLSFGKNNRITVAIIGFGRFGQLLTKLFIEFSNARILVVSGKKQLFTHKGVSFVDIKEISSADFIIPCVPISVFEKTIRKISPIIKNSAVIMDVCSVKILPVKVMKKYLSKNIQIIASHPMFGPDSFRINKGFNELKCVLFNISASKKVFLRIKSFFEQLGVIIIEISPEKHDQLIAWSLGYSYLVGKIGQRLKIRKTLIDTYDFKLLLQNIKIISNDSEKLFEDMQTFNPYAKDVRTKFLKVAEGISNNIR